ncbi:MAG: hypothetical protein WB791_11575 [Waddliaceae bacterium]
MCVSGDYSRRVSTWSNSNDEEKSDDSSFDNNAPIQPIATPEHTRAIIETMSANVAGRCGIINPHSPTQMHPDPDIGKEPQVKADLVSKREKLKALIPNKTEHLQNLKKMEPTSKVKNKIERVSNELNSKKDELKKIELELADFLKEKIRCISSELAKAVLWDCLSVWIKDFRCSGLDSKEHENNRDKIIAVKKVQLPSTIEEFLKQPLMLCDSTQEDIKKNLEESVTLLNQLPHELKGLLGLKKNVDETEIRNFVNAIYIKFQLLHKASQLKELFQRELLKRDSSGKLQTTKSVKKLRKVLGNSFLGVQTSMIQWGGSINFCLLDKLKPGLVPFLRVLDCPDSSYDELPLALDYLTTKFESLLRLFLKSHGVSIIEPSKDYLGRPISRTIELNRLMDHLQKMSVFKPNDKNLFQHLFTQTLNLRNRISHNEIPLQEYQEKGFLYLILVFTAILRLSTYKEGKAKAEFLDPKPFETQAKQSKVSEQFIICCREEAYEYVKTHGPKNILEHLSFQEGFLSGLSRPGGNTLEEQAFRQIVQKKPVILSATGRSDSITAHYGTEVDESKEERYKKIAAGEKGSFRELEKCRQSFEFELGPFLEELFCCFIDIKKFNPKRICDQLTHNWQGNSENPPEWVLSLRPAINHFYDTTKSLKKCRDISFDLCVNALSLRFEGLLRSLNKSFKRMSTITQILDSPLFVDFYGKEDQLFLRTLLSDKWGYGLRHQSAHHFHSAKTYKGRHGLRVSALLILSFLRLSRRSGCNSQPNLTPAPLTKFIIPVNKQCAEQETKIAEQFFFNVFEEAFRNNKSSSVIILVMALDSNQTLILIKSRQAKSYIRCSRQ